MRIRFAMAMALILLTPDRVQAQDGRLGEGHSDLHPWYRGLAQPGMSPGSCCSDQDCRPTQWRQGRAAIEVKIEGKWCPVPGEKILPIAAPDGQAHVCTAPVPAGGDPCAATVFCVVVGFGS